MYTELGRPGDAEREFRRAVEISPLNADARNLLAELLQQQSRAGEAEEQYRSSLDASPNSGALNGLGNILWSKGLQTDAIACWRQALELSPFDSHAHLSLGIAYKAQGRANEAEKEFRSVLLMDPKNERAVKAMQELKPAEFPAP
jgi:Flp pilus assembly protein TadD